MLAEQQDNWKAYVAAVNDDHGDRRCVTGRRSSARHCALPGLTPEREARIVRELAAQLEDFYREALAGGASEADADAHACRQIGDWDRMAQDVWLRRPPHTPGPDTNGSIEPRLERLQRTAGAPNRTEEDCSMFANIVRDTRYAIRQLLRDAGLHRRRDPHAGARHRRHQRHLQRRQRRAAAAAAVSRIRIALVRRARDRAEVRAILGRAGDVPRLAAAEHGVRADRAP